MSDRKFVTLAQVLEWLKRFESFEIFSHEVMRQCYNDAAIRPRLTLKPIPRHWMTTRPLSASKPRNMPHSQRHARTPQRSSRRR